MGKKINFDPNYLCYYMLYQWANNRDSIDPRTGDPSVVKFFNQGGTRSGKTYDAIHAIWKICDSNKNGKLFIAVYRETLVNAKDTTLKDFLECFDIMGLEDGVDYVKTGTNSSGRPIINLYGNTIEFKGMPDTAKEAGRSDIAYINELLESRNKDVVMGIMQRCSELFIADWNPSTTEHFAFEFSGHNIFYTTTSYLDNKHLSRKLVSLYESWCPYDFKDSHIDYIDGIEGLGLGFARRVWDKPEKPDTVLEDIKGQYRTPHPFNTGTTADRWRWLVYGEGEKARQDGAIFPNVTWISSFPKEIEDVYFGLDFGYSNDPSVLTRVGVDGKKVYAEKMCYQKTPEVEVLFDLIEPLILKEVERRKDMADGMDIPDVLVACDSSDKYRDVNFVQDLNVIASQKGYTWQFLKVKKPHIVTRIAHLKRFDLFFIEDKQFKIEQHNYVYMKGANGKPTNIPQPIDDFNHIFDSLMYCTWTFFKWHFADNENNSEEKG